MGSSLRLTLLYQANRQTGVGPQEPEGRGTEIGGRWSEHRGQWSVVGRRSSVVGGRSVGKQKAGSGWDWTSATVGTYFENSAGSILHHKAAKPKINTTQ